LALAVPLSRFTPRVGGGSAFYVRRLTHVYEKPDLATFFVDMRFFDWLYYRPRLAGETKQSTCCFTAYYATAAQAMGAALWT
jgi:hypothetical protein